MRKLSQKRSRRIIPILLLDGRLDALQDASFYHATDFIAIVPQGFHDSFWRGAPIGIETVAMTDVAKGY